MPALIDQLAGERPVWLIDPVDGTANYAAGEPAFAMMLALVLRGETLAGWIYEPIAEAMTWAVAGKGAYRNGTPLAVAKPAAPANMTGSLGARLRRDSALTAQFARIENLRCCGAEYAMLARGALHFAHYRRLKPWDHAAGALIYREAGGHTARLDGAPWQPGVPEGDGLLLAPDRATWDLLGSLIRPVLPR
jgi:fructose-1,6-bisphosphatase/inositol monophosphatase family enzyme